MEKPVLMKPEEVDTIISSYGNDKSQIIAILNDIQDKERYLPEDHLRQVARRLDIPLAQVYSISSFFRAFSLIPRGRYQCSVCMGTACHVRGAPRILDEMERLLKISSGGTTEDLLFSLDTVNCVGACALGPLLIIEGEYYGNAQPSKLPKIVEKYKTGGKSEAEEKPKTEPKPGTPKTEVQPEKRTAAPKPAEKKIAAKPTKTGKTSAALKTAARKTTAKKPTAKKTAKKTTVKKTAKKSSAKSAKGLRGKIKGTLKSTLKKTIEKASKPKTKKK